VRVLIFLLLGVYPWVLLLTFAISLYLTFVETREQHMDKRHTAWWLQLTFLLHFAGDLALRGWTFYRRRQSTA
jgi:membrane protein implicated in regulation of membrane protease activity